MNIQIELIAPGGVENLKVSSCPTPQPGPDDICILQESIGINFIYIYHRKGLYPLPQPAIPGVEAAGTILAVGDNVKELKEGDHIVYAGITGAYTATRVLPAWRAVKLSDQIDIRMAGGSFLRGLTAYMLLKQSFPVTKGNVILVHAAAGGLGTIVTRWAKKIGATVIGTVSTDEKAEAARRNGVDHVITGRNADLIAEVKRITNGQGVNYAIDGIGGDMLEKTISCVRRLGVIASIGQVAGPVSVSAIEKICSEQSVIFLQPSIMEFSANADTYRNAAKAVIELMTEGMFLKTRNEYALKDVAKAQNDLENGKITGYSILIPYPAQS